MSHLYLLESGNIVQSFSGVDYDVLGYVPPYHKEGDIEASNNNGSNGVFIHRMASLQTMSISSTRDHKAARRLGSSWPFDFSRGSRTVAGSLVFAMLDGDAFNKFVETTAEYKALSREDANHYSADALPPINIVFTASNESGSMLVGMLTGIRLTNTGMSFGIHDLYTEQLYSFVAERYEPLKEIRRTFRQESDIVVPGPAGNSELVFEADYEAALARTYGNAEWRRPSLKKVDAHTRGIGAPNKDKGAAHDRPVIQAYATPSRRLGP